MQISQAKKEKLKANLGKSDFADLHPRYPKGHPQGGKFMPKGSADYVNAVAKNTGKSPQEVKKALGSGAIKSSSTVTPQSKGKRDYKDVLPPEAVKELQDNALALAAAAKAQDIAEQAKLNAGKGGKREASKALTAAKKEVSAKQKAVEAVLIKNGASKEKAKQIAEKLIAQKVGQIKGEAKPAEKPVVKPVEKSKTEETKPKLDQSKIALLKEKVAKSAKETKAETKKVIKTKEEVAEKIKVEEKKESQLPQGKKTEFAESYKGAWSKAPKDLQMVLGAVDQPSKVEGSTAFCHPELGISMGNDARSIRANGVWRHEYGHWLDGQLHGKSIGANSKDPFNELIEKHSNGQYKNEEDLSRGLQSKGDEAFAVSVKRKISQEAFGDSDRFISEIKSKLSKGGEKRGYLSDSPEGNKAFSSDEKMLLDKQKKSESKFEKTYNLEYEKYKDSISDWIKGQTSIGGKPSQARIGEHIEHLKLANAIKEEATARASKKGKKNLEKNIEAETNKIIADKLKETLAGKLILSGTENIEKLFFNNTRRDLYNAIIDPENPVALAKALEKGLKDSAGMADDLIGSITSNKVGAGHADEYYANTKSYKAQNVEAFANLISIYGSGHPLAEEALKALSPNGFDFMKKTLKDSIEMLKGAK